jgi:hypothetical protein
MSGPTESIPVNERLLSRLDRVSGMLLLLWVGMALGIAMLAAPIAFQQLPSRELAGRLVGACFRWIDILAWFAFGLPFLLSFGARWLLEMKDAGIGAMTLWSAAALAALLMCFTSMAIVNPRMEAIRVRIGAPIETIPEDAPDRKAFNRAHSVSEQLMGLRLLLGLGLAMGVFYLPKEKPVERAETE